MLEPNATADAAAGTTSLGRPSQCRRDALSGRWVIFAPGRSKRPAEIIETELPVTSGSDCPFCAGNEQSTPPATLCFHSSDRGQASWAVRVVPNMFPAVLPDDRWDELGPIRRSNDWHRMPGTRHRRPQSEAGPSSQSGTSSAGSSHRHPPSGIPAVGIERAETDEGPHACAELFEAYELHGGHEVIVESPHHIESITQLAPEHAAMVFAAYAERMKYWFELPGVEYVVAFKNVGAAAGASLRHSHSQLIATSLLPPAAQETGQRAARYFQHRGRCLMCDTLAAEQAAGRRIVVETEHLVAFCPFASRLPYMVRITPQRHLDRFEIESSAVLSELSRLTQRVVAAMESMFVSCSYNYTIHSRPRRSGCGDSFHWWVEIFPRLTKVAGFEWGSDCYINPVTPEVAAAHLRGEPFGEELAESPLDPINYSD